jgi:hypothetical protein
VILICIAFDDGAGGGRILAVMSFLRSEAAPLYRYHGSVTLEAVPCVSCRCSQAIAGAVVTADHAVKTHQGWKRVRDTGALSASRADMCKAHAQQFHSEMLL